MSSTDHRGIPPGNAAIIAAVIGAVALILGAKSQTIQVFLGADTPTAVAQSNTFGLHSPQPTYTLLPTYTPYPTFTPNIRVATQGPIIVTPTGSADQQNPPPGSIIASGQGYKKNGIIVTVLRDIFTFGDNIGAHVTIKNESGQQQIILWKNSYMHLRDDKGRVYRRWQEGQPDLDQNIQFTVRDGDSYTIYHCPSAPDFHDTCYSFIGPLEPTVKYFIITIDQLAGMTNMNWRYDLQ